MYLNKFSRYPGYNGALEVTGKVELSFRDTRVYFVYNLDGVDRECQWGPIGI